uniref:Band 7 domain-containing protein n=1 Tax=Timema poppense TaxID=170557 RepID=A0A7R9DB76_TIMPO|nr:unnamed protein product [Timema poppensis]
MYLQVLSRDSVTVNVDAVVFYRVNSPIMATNNVEDYRCKQLWPLCTTISTVIVASHQAIGSRFKVCWTTGVLTKDSVTVTVDAVVYYRVNEPLGAIVKVNNYSKDVRLPVQLQRAMAAEAEAAREARAKVIAAEGEMKASRALKEAADVIGESPAALQLRYLQTLNTISAEKNSTIIFPLPMDMITPFLGIPRKT